VSYKKSTYIALIIIIALGIILYLETLDFPQMRGRTIGPADFPQAILILLFIFSILSLIATYRKKDFEVSFNRKALVFLTIGLLLAYVIGLLMTRLFYPLSFMFLAILFYIYSVDEFSINKILKSLIPSGVLILFVYVVFDVLLRIRF